MRIWWAIVQAGLHSCAGHEQLARELRERQQQKKAAASTPAMAAALSPSAAEIGIYSHARHHHIYTPEKHATTDSRRTRSLLNLAGPLQKRNAVCGAGAAEVERQCCGARHRAPPPPQHPRTSLLAAAVQRPRAADHRCSAAAVQQKHLSGAQRRWQRGRGRSGCCCSRGQPVAAAPTPAAAPSQRPGPPAAAAAAAARGACTCALAQPDTRRSH